jgi:hypothetical protein
MSNRFYAWMAGMFIGAVIMAPMFLGAVFDTGKQDVQTQEPQPMRVTILQWAGEGGCIPPRHVYVGGTIFVFCSYEGLVLREDVKIRGGKRKLAFSRVERSDVLASGRRCPFNMSCFKVKLTGKRAKKGAVYSVSATKKLGLQHSWTITMPIDVLEDCFVDCKSHS